MSLDTFFDLPSKRCLISTLLQPPSELWLVSARSNRVCKNNSLWSLFDSTLWRARASALITLPALLQVLLLAARPTVRRERKAGTYATLRNFLVCVKILVQLGITNFGARLLNFLRLTDLLAEPDLRILNVYARGRSGSLLGIGVVCTYLVLRSWPCCLNKNVLLFMPAGQSPSVRLKYLAPTPFVKTLYCSNCPAPNSAPVRGYAYFKVVYFVEPDKLSALLLESIDRRA